MACSLESDDNHVRLYNPPQAFTVPYVVCTPARRPMLFHCFEWTLHLPQHIIVPSTRRLRYRRWCKMLSRNILDVISPYYFFSTKAKLKPPPSPFCPHPRHLPFFSFFPFPSTFSLFPSFLLSSLPFSTPPPRFPLVPSLLFLAPRCFLVEISMFAAVVDMTQV